MDPGKWVSDCLSKNKYSTKDFARQVKAEIEAERNVSLRVYLCPHCKGYHLTKNVCQK